MKFEDWPDLVPMPIAIKVMVQEYFDVAIRDSGTQKLPIIGYTAAEITHALAEMLLHLARTHERPEMLDNYSLFIGYREDEPDE